MAVRFALALVACLVLPLAVHGADRETPVILPLIGAQAGDPGWERLPADLKEKYRTAGMRGSRRTDSQAKAVRAAVPAATLALGPDAERVHLRGLDWSHRKPYSAGGSSSARNGVFEDASRNRARGAAPMTRAELKAAQSSMVSKAVKGWAGRIGGAGMAGAGVGTVAILGYLAGKHYVAYQSDCVSSDQAVEAFASDAKNILPAAAIVGGSGGALAAGAVAVGVSSTVVGTLMGGIAIAGLSALAYDVVSDVREWRDASPPAFAGSDDLYTGLSGYLPLLEQNCASGSITLAPENQDNPAHWLFVVDGSGRAFTLYRDVWRVGAEMAVGPHRIMRGWEKPPRLGED